MRKILLFDIDGTILLTGGAGKRAMNRAFYDLFGIDNALEHVHLSGMTDHLIYKNACRQNDVPYTDEEHEVFRESYIVYLREEIEKPHPEKRVLPGVEALLERLDGMPQAELGLLTGNYQQGAMTKLGHFGLDGYFSFGAYGDDSDDRDQLLPFAIKRFEARNGNASVNSESVWIIGDTPRDISCARPHGADVLAVATGNYSAEQLRSENPTALLPDLQNTEQVIAVLLGENVSTNKAEK